jgi:flavin-dependent dehydrogenase
MRDGTINATRASRDLWDAVVVGAGPAGSLAARQLARSGLSVLLVDRQRFPRWKVCGGCLNPSTVKTLEEAGLGTLLSDLSAVPLNELRIAAWSRQASVQLEGSAALSRSAFDAGLLTAAIEAGAEFLPGAPASLDPSFHENPASARRPEPGLEQGARISEPGQKQDARILHLRSGSERASITARVVVAADGLNGALLSSAGEGGGEGAGEGAGEWRAPAARVGAGAAVLECPDFYTPGTIFMAVGAGGYVGLVRLEDHSLNLAAAFDRDFVRHAGGVGHAAAAVVKEAGFPDIDGIETLAWKGTVPLTRRPATRAIERVFAIGDAAGYVEPFTGEGMAWALAGAMAVSPFVRSAARSWDPALMAMWDETYRETVGRAQSTCALVARMLRHPIAVRSVVALLAKMPAFARPVARRIGRPRRVSSAETRLQETIA